MGQVPGREHRGAWAIRGGYFWYYAAIGTFMPFAALYYRDLGFSGIDVGILTALPALGMSILGPFMGAIADARGSHRALLRGALGLAALTGLAMAQVSTFWPFFFLVAVLAIATVSPPPLLDSYAVVTSERTSTSYGSLRVWGSLGYMAAALAMGRLVGEEVSPILLVGYATCLSLSLVSSLGLPVMAERRAQPIISGLVDVLRIPQLRLLLLVAYLLASCGALLNIYFGVHLEDLGASTSLMGFAFSLSAVAELPIVAGSAWLLRRVGPVRLIMIAIGAYIVRFTILSLVSDPAVAVASQLLHGLCFGGFLIASVTLAHTIAGRTRAATAQSLLSAMSFGLGSITGALIGGVLLDSVGTSGIYGGAAVVMAVNLGILMIGNRVLPLDRPATPTR